LSESALMLLFLLSLQTTSSNAQRKCRQQLRHTHLCQRCKAFSLFCLCSAAI